MRPFPIGFVVAVLLCSTGTAIGLDDSVPSILDSGAPASVPLIGPGPIGPEARLYPPMPKTGSTSQRIDVCVRSAMLAANTPGAAVAVMENGEVIYRKGYGVKRRSGDGPVTADTVFRIGSITKMMTAAAVLQLAESGQLSLDDPVTLWVPEFESAPPWRAEHITIRHLLTHSAGLPDRLGTIDGRTDAEALSDWAASQGEVGLHAPPGAFWNYSNPNFMLAGLIVERASGTTYHQYMRDNVWAPAGMSDTTLLPFDVVWSGDWAFGHYVDPLTGEEYRFRPDSYDYWVGAPAGFAFSTVGDLVHWTDLLMTDGGTVLTRESCQAMQAPQVDLHYLSTDFYGFGVFSERYNGAEVKQHGGNIPGWGAYLLWVPESRFSVAVLANTFQSLPAAAYCIADHVLDLENEPAPDETTDVLSWRRFEGQYDVVDVLGREWQGAVSWSDQGLELEMLYDGDEPDHASGPLFPIFADTFVFDFDGDGIPDIDFTFINSSGEPAPTRWMRNRSFVGAMATVPRQGDGRADP